MKPRYMVTQFDNRTFLVSDTQTGYVYAECGDSEVGGDAEKRSKNIARLLNGDDTNVSDINARMARAYALAKIAKRDAKITGVQMMAEIAKREPKRRAAMKGRK